MKQHRINAEVKAGIIRRVKEEGILIKQAAEEHGITDSAIYKWLGRTMCLIQRLCFTN
jgi:transposase-like protein